MWDWFTANANVIGLVFFFLFFVIAALWLLRPGAKEKAQDHAHIPLREEDDG